MIRDEAPSLALVVGGGQYKWYLVGIGILSMAVGGALSTDFHGAATTIRNRRLAWLGAFAGPVWFDRLWGVLAVVNGLMLIIQ